MSRSLVSYQGVFTANYHKELLSEQQREKSE